MNVFGRKVYILHTHTQTEILWLNRMICEHAMPHYCHFQQNSNKIYNAKTGQDIVCLYFDIFLDCFNGKFLANATNGTRNTKSVYRSILLCIVYASAAILQEPFYGRANALLLLLPAFGRKSEKQNLQIHFQPKILLLGFVAFKFSMETLVEFYQFVFFHQKSIHSKPNAHVAGSISPPEFRRNNK